MHRAIEHGKAWSTCRQQGPARAFPMEVRGFADTFIDLQKARQQADYPLEGEYSNRPRVKIRARNGVLLCNYPRAAGHTKPFHEIFSRRRSPLERSVTLRAAPYSPVFAPRRPDAERLCRRAARGRENHPQSYMLRGERAPIMSVCHDIADFVLETSQSVQLSKSIVVSGLGISSLRPSEATLYVPSIFLNSEHN